MNACDVDRRRTLAALACVLSGFALLPRAAMAEKVWRVGLLDFGRQDSPISLIPTLVKAMARIGYVEGRNIAYDRRWVNGDFDRIAQSLTRPGRNVTGITTGYREVVGKQIEVLKAVIPAPWKLAWMDSEGGSPTRFAAGIVQEAARQNGVPVVTLSPRDKGEVERAFASMRIQGIRVAMYGALLSLLGYDDAAARALAFANGVATVSNAVDDVPLGTLLAYESNWEDDDQRVADLMDKILHGTPVGEIPFELPTTFRLAINLASAKALGLTVPPEILLRADKVYR